jgi:hypothetical protein
MGMTMKVNKKMQKKMLTKPAGIASFDCGTRVTADKSCRAGFCVGVGLGKTKTTDRQIKMEKLKYVVPSIGTAEVAKDSPLCLVDNPPSRLRAKVSEAELRQALLRHCKTSNEQAEAASK